MPRAKKSSTQRQRAISKAEQILQGATQVFLAHGYDGTSMDLVAQTSGVSKQTLYVYFADKQTLFKALVAQMAKQRFEHSLKQSLVGDPAKTLPRITEQSLSHLVADKEYHDFVRLMISESKRFPELMEVFLRNVTLPSIETLRDYLNQYPELNIPDPEATAHILLGAVVFYMLTQEVMGGKAVLPMSQKRLGDSLMHLMGIAQEIS